MKALLSIKPEFVSKISDGTKKFEFRKILFRKKIESIIVYSTMPEGKVVGEIKIKDILQDSPKKIWDKTKNSAGVDKHFFSEYYLNKDNAVAIEIENYLEFEKPKTLNDYGIKNAPQSYVYI